MPLALGLGTTLLTGCAGAGFDPAACPTPVIYSAGVMLRAAEELGFLPPGSVIGDRFLPDYSRLREQSWACLGEDRP